MTVRTYLGSRKTPIAWKRLWAVVGGCLYLTVLSSAVISAIVPPAAEAGPATCRGSAVIANNLRVLRAGGTVNGTTPTTEFYNYDFNSPTCARANNVAWAVDLVFWGNASIQAVYNGLNTDFGWGKPLAATEYARFLWHGAWLWGQDAGRKTLPASPGTWDDHYRVYAAGQRLYSIAWGYFVFGTIHRDYNEFSIFTDATYGESELAEADLAVDAENVFGWNVDWDTLQLQNQQYGQQGNHIWDNDGLATMIYIT